MLESIWTWQDAKNRFSTVVDAARVGKSQWVTQRGVPVVVVVSAEEYERLHPLEEMQRPSFVGHLLAMPRDDGEFEPLPLTPRDVEL